MIARNGERADVTVHVAEMLLRAAGMYLAAGAAFAAFFMVIGAGLIDRDARSAPLQFRLVAAPAAALLWPALALLMIKRMIAGGPR